MIMQIKFAITKKLRYLVAPLIKGQRKQEERLEIEVSKIPYMIIVGEKEQEKETISVRKHGGENLGNMIVDTLIDTINKEIEEVTKFNN